MSARWVPRLLSAEIRFASGYPQCFFAVNRIITTDETWENFYDPKQKRESMVWKTSSSPPATKAKVAKSATSSS